MPKHILGSSLGINGLSTITKWLVFSMFAAFASTTFAHDLSAANANFVQNMEGSGIAPLMYLGAKHMYTGYDHLLFLLGVIFFLRSAKDIFIYVTLFTVGHSCTLLLGVLLSWQVNPYVVDAIIGLSVVYKGLENLGAFHSLIKFRLNPKVAVFGFGLVHGLGLATKLQEYINRDESLFKNLLSFNVGIELGQIAALIFMLIALTIWRRHDSFYGQAMTLNIGLVFAGWLLFGLHLSGIFLGHYG